MNLGLPPRAIRAQRALGVPRGAVCITNRHILPVNHRSGPKQRRPAVARPPNRTIAGVASGAGGVNVILSRRVIARAESRRRRSRGRASARSTSGSRLRPLAAWLVPAPSGESCARYRAVRGSRCWVEGNPSRRCGLTTSTSARWRGPRGWRLCPTWCSGGGCWSACRPPGCQREGEEPNGEDQPDEDGEPALR